MPKQTFVFKKFSVFQHKCAHKVGTDAVLLGAWAKVENAETILDIGTGTGVIALMMAQKSTAVIDAIDIEKDSYEQASENAKHSIWANRIRMFHTDLQHYLGRTTIRYDVVITNPPYFIDSYKAPDEQRSHARHNDTLPFEDLISGVKYLLKPSGKFYIILPTKEAQLYTSMAEKHGLYLTCLLKVKTKTSNASEKRHVMLFELVSKPLHVEEMSIEEDDHHSYTDEYKQLTQDFYLHF